MPLTASGFITVKPREMSSTLEESSLGARARSSVNLLPGTIRVTQDPSGFLWGGNSDDMVHLERCNIAPEVRGKVPIPVLQPPVRSELDWEDEMRPLCYGVHRCGFDRERSTAAAVPGDPMGSLLFS
jgi:hypothetical protein